MTRSYLTVSIPYVNARPHLGYALELVQADVLARSRRSRNEEVRLLGGTDENALKNVLAADVAGVPVERLVEENAARFSALATPLGIRFDDFIRTSADPRHRPGVEALWRKCAEAGDLYRSVYEGQYCTGCEQFYGEADLVDGSCPDHGTATEFVSEENWFFRLSRYGETIAELIESGRIAIIPDVYRREVLAGLRLGLADVSVSRSRGRARGWGIPVPGDPSQVIYVWWDALANYVTALGYGTDPNLYGRWWRESDERIHVIGKGILRFHSLYWPAMLLSAGEPLPTTIAVHPYLTVEGKKLSKSSGVAVDPVQVVEAYGTDALRWWLLREVGPATDADYTAQRLVARANDELANGLGNLVRRTTTLVDRHFGGRLPAIDPGGRERALLEEVRQATTRAGRLDDFDFRAATAAIVTAVGALNGYVEEKRPWELVATDLLGSAAVLDTVVRSCRMIAESIEPFIPTTAARIHAALAGDGATRDSAPVFTRIELVPDADTHGDQETGTCSIRDVEPPI